MYKRQKKDIVLALDIASTEMFDEAKKIGKEGYYFWKTDTLKTKSEMIQYLVDLCDKYPIASIEDGLAEEEDVYKRQWESKRKRLHIYCIKGSRKTIKY